MVVIKKISNIIPVDFGEFQLEYVANDENIKRMKTIGQNLEKRAKRLEEADDESAFKEAYKASKDSWTELFDEEAFEKVYKFSGETTTDTIYYLIQAIRGIVSEFENRNSEQAIKIPRGLVMLDLSRKLTDELVIGDKVYSLNMSFDNIIRLFEMWCDEEIPEQVKPFFALKMLTGEGFGSFSIEDAMAIFQQIFEEHIQLKSLKDVSVEYDLAGNVMQKEPSTQSKEPPVYDISLDGDFIYASFMQAYDIDLLEERGKLHWKKFNALLSGLPEGTKFVEVIKIRKYKPRKGDSQAYIDEMMKLKKEYALPDSEEYDDEDDDYDME